MGDKPLCILKDCVESFSDDGPLGPVPGAMHTVAELADHLRAAAAGQPRQFNLELTEDVRVVLHLGGPWAAIMWTHLYYARLSPPPGHPPTWQARAEHPPAVEYVPFLLGGREADIRAEWLLPADEVIRMAVYIAAHRTLPPWCVWVDIDGNRYSGGPVGEPGPVPEDSAGPF